MVDYVSAESLGMRVASDERRKASFTVDWVKCPVVEVEIKELFLKHDWIQAIKVEHQMGSIGKYSKPHVSLIKGEMVIEDGNHRIAALILSGFTHTECLVYSR